VHSGLRGGGLQRIQEEQGSRRGPREGRGQIPAQRISIRGEGVFQSTAGAVAKGKGKQEERTPLNKKEIVNATRGRGAYVTDRIEGGGRERILLSSISHSPEKK